MVPEEGFEPSRPCGHWILNPARLPFRHSGRDCVSACHLGASAATSADAGARSYLIAPRNVKRGLMSWLSQLQAPMAAHPALHRAVLAPQPARSFLYPPILPAADQRQSIIACYIAHSDYTVHSEDTTCTRSPKPLEPSPHFSPGLGVNAASRARSER